MAELGRNVVIDAVSLYGQVKTEVLLKFSQDWELGFLENAPRFAMAEGSKDEAVDFPGSRKGTDTWTETFFGFK